MNLKFIFLIPFILFLIFFLNIVRTNNLEILLYGINFFQFDEISKQIIRPTVNVVENFEYLIESLSSLSDFDWFKQYYYYTPLSFFPRYFWFEKPVTSFLWRITEFLSGESVGRSNPVTTVTFLGEAYFEGWFLGITLTIIVIFILYRLLNNTGYIFQSLYFYALIYMPMMLRSGISSLIYFFLSIYISIILIKFINNRTISQFKNFELNLSYLQKKFN